MNIVFFNCNSDKNFLSALVVTVLIFSSVGLFQVANANPLAKFEKNYANKKAVDQILFNYRKQIAQEKEYKKKSFLERLRISLYMKGKAFKKYYKKNHETIESIAKYAAVSFLTIFCYRNCDSFLNWLLEPSYDKQANFSTQIRFGSTQLLGSQKPNGDYTVQQVKATGQQGTSCGYHALKNSILALLGLLKNQDVQAIQFESLSPEWESRLAYGTSETNPGTWRNYALNNMQHADVQKSSLYVRCDKYGDDIDGTLIEQIIKLETSYNESTIFSTIDPAALFIVEDLKMIDKDDHGRDLIEIKSYLLNSSDNDSVKACALIFNTGESLGNASSQTYASTNNHWIAIIISLTNDTRRSYTFIDSLNRDWLESPFGKRIIEVLEQQVFSNFRSNNNNIVNVATTNSSKTSFDPQVVS